MTYVKHVTHTGPTLLAVVSALMRQGYRVSRSHTDPGAIKTDAPSRALWDVLRCWTRTQTRTKALSENAPGFRIMQKARPISSTLVTCVTCVAYTWHMLHTLHTLHTLHASYTSHTLQHTLHLITGAVGGG